jgi:hypothetical protein
MPFGYQWEECSPPPSAPLNPFITSIRVKTVTAFHLVKPHFGLPADLMQRTSTSNLNTHIASIHNALVIAMKVKKPTNLKNPLSNSQN